MTSAVIIGAGVAGMTAAQELVERGVEVVVLDAAAVVGGKSRSIPMIGTGTEGRGDLAGEHGFRFFPGFYQHVPDTMSRIPTAEGTVLDHLVDTSRTLGLLEGGEHWIAPNTLQHDIDDVTALLRFLHRMVVAESFGVSRADSAFFVERTLEVLTSCEARREAELEHLPYWDFMDAGRRSEAYQRYVVSGITRNLVACRAQDISTRTAGVISSQLFLDIVRGCADRVLDGPTNERWFDPWKRHLEGLGVRFELSTPVTGLDVEGERIGAVRTPGRSFVADHVVVAIPPERVTRLLGEPVLQLDPALRLIDELQTEWMNGVLFFLDRAIPMHCGHAIQLDSPWALTTVAHEQLGDGRVRSILSVCVSDWGEPGMLTGKPARECSRQEIHDEVWAQLCVHFAGPTREALDAAGEVTWFLDPAIQHDSDGKVTNADPLLINTVGSWESRPEAKTALDNLWLAGDYVRTTTDLATMESANEAARRAVNGILDAIGSSHSRCTLFPLKEPAFLAPLKHFDHARLRAGLPHALQLVDRHGSSGFAALSRLIRRVDEAIPKAIESLHEAGLGEALVQVDRWVDILMAALIRPDRPAPPPPPPAPEPVEAPRWHGTLHELEPHPQLGRADQNLDAVRRAVTDGLHSVERHLSGLGRGRGGAADRAAGTLLALPGKRVRAMHLLLCSGLGRGALATGAVEAALVAEMVHAASLLHDDVIDLGELRRGELSARAVHGDSASVLGGNLLMVEAASLLLDTRRVDLLDDLFDTLRGMIDGESLQLDTLGDLELDSERYIEALRRKTGLLFRWCTTSGARLAGMPDRVVHAAGEFGEAYGIAYQLVDDWLDVSGDASTLGKTPLADLRKGQVTAPVLFAAQRAPRRMEALLRDVPPAGGIASTAFARELHSLIRETEAERATATLAAAWTTRAVGALEGLPWGGPRALLEGLATSSLNRASRHWVRGGALVAADAHDSAHHRSMELIHRESAPQGTTKRQRPELDRPMDWTRTAADAQRELPRTTSGWRNSVIADLPRRALHPVATQLYPSLTALFVISPDTHHQAAKDVACRHGVPQPVGLEHEVDASVPTVTLRPNAHPECAGEYLGVPCPRRVVPMPALHERHMAALTASRRFTRCPPLVDRVLERGPRTMRSIHLVASLARADRRKREIDPTAVGRVAADARGDHQPSADVARDAVHAGGRELECLGVRSGRMTRHTKGLPSTRPLFLEERVGPGARVRRPEEVFQMILVTAATLLGAQRARVFDSSEPRARRLRRGLRADRR